MHCIVLLLSLGLEGMYLKQGAAGSYLCCSTNAFDAKWQLPLALRGVPPACGVMASLCQAGCVSNHIIDPLCMPLKGLVYSIIRPLQVGL
jgi:hypothetical protein